MSTDRECRGKNAIGVGSPIVDLLAKVPDALVHSIRGEKGGMELVNPQEMDDLLEVVGQAPLRAPGGSAGNTIFAMARLGVHCAFLGKLGGDKDGDYYQEAFEAACGDCSRFKISTEAPTARCLSLITPDSERTMRTELGAATLLAPNEVSERDFAGYDFAHVEGYLLFNQDLAQRVLESAKGSGAMVSLDLGSFEVVESSRGLLPSLLENCVDLVFANEDEAEAYTGQADPEAALDTLGALCEVAAVKLGAEGALLKKGGETIRVDAVRVEHALDTTGAGDCWAAGFLYGHLNGHDLKVCGELGALLGAEAVKQVGASPSEEGWLRIAGSVAQLREG